MQISHEPEAFEATERGSSLAHSDFIEEREELDRVLHHPEISRSISLVRFLTFICQMYFEDRSVEIREHSIAVKALGRKESSFDSQMDPIVRVTARALRKRLREFYEHEGKDHPLEIVIPLGRYIPQFVRRTPQEPHSAAALNPAMAGAELTPFEPSPPRIDSPPPTDPASQGERPATAIAASFPASWRSRNPLLWPGVALILILPAIFYAGIVMGSRRHEALAEPVQALKWGQPVWSDEFDGAPQSIPDPARWTFDVGSQNSWGNHELETYCSPGPRVSRGCDPLHPNAFLDGDGHLVLRAQRNADGNWTSARITTRGLKTFQYGRIEARMRLPVGTGLWPAFWMLGADYKDAGWPASGAIDIVENVGLTSSSNGLGPGMIRASLHGPGYAGGNSLRRNFKLTNGARIDDGAFHTYGVIWSPGMLQFYVDDPTNIFFVQDVSSLPEGGVWAFDHPFYLVMNLAVGGDWSGDPDNTTPTPADVLVDYVRVYRIPSASPSLSLAPVHVKRGALTSGAVEVRGQRGTGRVYLSCSTVPATVVCALEASTVDFSTSDLQRDAITLSTDSVVDGSRVVAQPGLYQLTITATTMSGDRSQLTETFEVQSVN